MTLLLAGKTYGSKAATIDAPIWIAHQIGATMGIRAGKIVMINDDAEKTARTALSGESDPCPSDAREFVATSSAAQALALTHMQWTWPLTSVVTVSPGSTVGATDLGDIGPADGWVTVGTHVHTTIGGTNFSAQWKLKVTVALSGGLARLVIDGGSFSDQQIETDLDLPGGTVQVVDFGPVAIPITASPTAYSLKVQVKANADSLVTANFETEPTHRVRVGGFGFY